MGTFVYSGALDRSGQVIHLGETYPFWGKYNLDGAKDFTPWGCCMICILGLYLFVFLLPLSGRCLPLNTCSPQANKPSPPKARFMSCSMRSCTFYHCDDLLGCVCYDNVSVSHCCTASIPVESKHVSVSHCCTASMPGESKHVNGRKYYYVLRHNCVFPVTTLGHVCCLDSLSYCYNTSAQSVCIAGLTGDHQIRAKMLPQETVSEHCSSKLRTCLGPQWSKHQCFLTLLTLDVWLSCSRSSCCRTAQVECTHTHMG